MSEQFDRLLKDLDAAADLEVGYRVPPETAAYLAAVLRAGRACRDRLAEGELDWTQDDQAALDNYDNAINAGGNDAEG